MNKELIAELLRAFDWNLTGCSINKAKLTQQSQLHLLDRLAEWEKIEYYLSDGGYSRLWVDPFEVKVFLGGNSSPKTVAAWERNKENLYLLEVELLEEFRRVRYQVDFAERQED